MRSEAEYLWDAARHYKQILLCDSLCSSLTPLSLSLRSSQHRGRFSA